MKNSILNKVKDDKLLIPLICSASVLRKEKLLRLFLKFSKVNNFNKISIYEAILQTYLFAGFPVALNSLKIYSEYFIIDHSYNYEDINDLINKGETNCKKIYGRKYDKLISNVKSFSPELSKWLIIEGYGKVLNRKGLSLKERELSIIAVLASLKYEDQLFSHINGAIRLNVPIEKIESLLKNLEIVGGKRISEFGLNVLLKYKNQKG